ncbi:hypothetical protein KA529_02200 [Candidatus Saccharibacteria bacterium]|nr:hypothetical protein [Candidatus Saccharibacteria bacterium]
MIPLLFHVFLFVAVSYLAYKKRIDKSVFFLLLGVFLLASAGEELIATGFIRDGGSSQLIADYASYSKGTWFRFGLGVILTLVYLFDLLTSSNKATKK